MNLTSHIVIATGWVHANSSIHTLSGAMTGFVRLELPQAPEKAPLVLPSGNVVLLSHTFQRVGYRFIQKLPHLRAC